MTDVTQTRLRGLISSTCCTSSILLPFSDFFFFCCCSVSASSSASVNLISCSVSLTSSHCHLPSLSPLLFSVFSEPEAAAAPPPSGFTLSLFCVCDIAVCTHLHSLSSPIHTSCFAIRSSSPTSPSDYSSPSLSLSTHSLSRSVSVCLCVRVCAPMRRDALASEQVFSTVGQSRRVGSR